MSHAGFREACSRQRGQQVQRPRVGHMPGVSKGHGRPVWLSQRKVASTAFELLTAPWAWAYLITK